MSKHYKNVVLGGGNAAGYLAREWVARGGPKGELAIVGEEPVRAPWACACCYGVPGCIVA